MCGNMCSLKMEESSDRFNNSDVKMVATKTFEDILNTIKNSNLNFHLQLSPFSAKISLKKSLVCDKFGSPLLPNLVDDGKPLIERNHQLELEIVQLESRYESLAQQYNSACLMIKSFEDQIKSHNMEAAHAVSECQVVIDQLKNRISQLELVERAGETEIEDLKRRIKKSDEVAIRLNRELNNIRLRNQDEKVVMKKDHKIQLKSLKKTIGKLTGENLRLKKLKEQAAIEKVVRSMVRGKNNAEVVNSDTCGEDMDVSDYDPSTVICSLCGIIIQDYKPKFFLGEEINPACENCDDTVSSDGCSVASDGEKTDNEISSALSLEKIDDIVCNHSPQCIVRQPFPPPLPLVTHLRNDSSMYHVHMMNRGGVPGQYGGHDHCLRAYSKNYGCEGCIWLKWHGDLHGFPDIHPHDFKKHLPPDST